MILKMVFFIHSLGPGGAERVAVNLANHWAGKSWQVTVVTLASRDSDCYELHPSVRRVALDLARESRNSLMGLANNFRRIVALRRVLREVRPHVALAMMNTSNILLALAVWNTPNVVALGSEHIHPPRVELGLLWRMARWWSYGRLHAVAALTEESAEWISENTCARRVPVIPNAVTWPLEARQPVVEPVKALANHKRLLIGVGRLDWQKGFDLLVDSFSEIAASHPEWGLIILGEGSERERLENQIKSRGMVNRVLLPGRVGNLGQWYEAADLYVMSSRFEGFPNTLTEAMAHGLPAVSFDCDTGPRDIVRDEVDGLLIPPGNMDAFKAALERMMEDEPLRDRFGARAIEVRERFSIGKVTAMWEKLFGNVANC